MERRRSNGHPRRGHRPRPPQPLGTLPQVPVESEGRKRWQPGGHPTVHPGSQGGKRERGGPSGSSHEGIAAEGPDTGDRPQQQQQQQPQPQQQPQQQQQSDPRIRPRVLQPPLQFQPQRPQQPPSRHADRWPMVLFKVDKSPAGYDTKWEELHPGSQACLLQIESRIMEYRNESQRLDQCSQLCDSSLANNRFELDATRIVQELGGISIAMDRERNLVQVLMTSVKEMMMNTEFAISSFMILHHKFLHRSATGTSNVDLSSQTSGENSACIAQPIASPVRPHDSYSGVTKRSSPFFTKTVAEFGKCLAEYRRWIEELEQLLDTKSAFSTSGTSLGCLPVVLSNAYDYFISIAAKMENVHQCIESMKATYLADRRRRGAASDPFFEADRRETAKLEVAARRIHPTLHLSAIPSWPSSQVTSLFSNSAMSGRTFQFFCTNL